MSHRPAAAVLPELEPASTYAGPFAPHAYQPPHVNSFIAELETLRRRMNTDSSIYGVPLSHAEVTPVDAVMAKYHARRFATPAKTETTITLTATERA